MVKGLEPQDTDRVKMSSDEDEEDLDDEEDTIKNDEDIPIEPEEDLREE